MKNHIKAHLATWNWKRVPLSLRSELPDDPGVYTLFSMGRCMYVGKAEQQSILSRWRGKGHHKYHEAADLAYPELRYKTLPQGQVHAFEQRLIRKLDPPWNGRSPRNWFQRNWLGLVLLGVVLSVGMHYVQPGYLIDTIRLFKETSL
jgi:hypothetical protein